METRNSTNLSKIQRSRAVKDLAVTTENYEEALQVLDERYVNAQIIVSIYFEEFTR